MTGESAAQTPAVLHSVVAVADRETLRRIREAFAAQPGIDLIGVAGDGIEAAQLTAATQPDFVILDDRLDGDGLRVCSVINQIAPRTKVVLLVAGINEDALLKAARAGSREVLSYAFDPGEFLKAVGRLTAADAELIGKELAWATDPRSFPRLLAVSSAKGGTGVTTISANLAAALGQSKAGRTALLDANPFFADSAAMLNISPRHSLADVMQNLRDADSIYQDPAFLEYCTTTSPDYDLVVSASTDLSLPAPPPPVLTRAALAMKRRYRFVVLDAPRGLLLDPDPSIVSFWRLLLIVDLRDGALLSNTKRMLDHIRDAAPTEGRVGAILNPDSKPSEFTAKDVQDLLDVPVVAAIPEDTNLSRAANIGRPLVIGNPRSPAARAILDLARKLIETANQPGQPTQFLASATRDQAHI